LAGNGNHYRALEAEKNSLISQLHSTSDPDARAAIQARISQVKSEQQAVYSATQNMLASNNAGIAKAVDTDLNSLQNEAKSLNKEMDEMLFGGFFRAPATGNFENDVKRDVLRNRLQTVNWNINQLNQ
jgi:hypothetical protein